MSRFRTLCGGLAAISIFAALAVGGFGSTVSSASHSSVSAVSVLPEASCMGCISSANS